MDYITGCVYKVTFVDLLEDGKFADLLEDENKEQIIKARYQGRTADVGFHKWLVIENIKGDTMPHATFPLLLCDAATKSATPIKSLSLFSYQIKQINNGNEVDEYIIHCHCGCTFKSDNAMLRVEYECKRHAQYLESYAQTIKKRETFIYAMIEYITEIAPVQSVERLPIRKTPEDTAQVGKVNHCIWDNEGIFACATASPIEQGNCSFHAGRRDCTEYCYYYDETNNHCKSKKAHDALIDEKQRELQEHNNTTQIG